MWFGTKQVDCKFKAGGGRHLIVAVAAVLLSVALPSAGWAQLAGTKPSAAKTTATPPAVQVDLEQFKVVKDDHGKESLADASKVKPGDVVEYRATYVNQSKQSISGLIATLPIPTGTTYLPKTASAGGRTAEAATLDGHYEAEPLVRKVSRPDGSTRTEPVPYADYRSLRWKVGQLAPAGSITVSARVEISALSADASSGSAPAAASADAGASRQASGQR